MIVYKKGDLLESAEPVIMHGCNCSNGFGSGFAGQVAKKYPKVKKEFHQLYSELSEMYSQLGDLQVVNVNPNLTIINAYTQSQYGPRDEGPYVSYYAIKEVFTEALSRFNSLACPKIGAGLAGGNWEIIEQIINEVSGDKEVRVYVL